MRTKRLLHIIPITLALLLACQSLTPSYTDDDNSPTQTQETIYQPTIALTPTEAPNSSTAIPEVEMVLVPEGEFIMGLDSPREFGPSHTVYLDAYYIDKYEVTNSQYRACVNAGVCEAQEKGSNTFENPEFDSYPVGNVNWDMAKAFCEWRGGHLPTEAQWEKAARGTDGRTYPWGEEEQPMDETFGNFKYKEDTNSQGPTGGTVPVGSYEKGISPFGVYDMNGNVSEWVADWFSATYYQTSPSSNPLGPESGECMYGSGACKVMRGGGWMTVAYSTWRRIESSPSSASGDVGFRCTRTP